jgi:hypothetical protein
MREGHPVENPAGRRSIPLGSANRRLRLPDHLRLYLDGASVSLQVDMERARDRQPLI